MNINIPRNDYKEPTEVREWVVQGICEAFLDDSCWHTFHPDSDGKYRYATWKLRRRKQGEPFYGFGSIEDDAKVTFNRKEMSCAFQELINAGYYMFRVYNYDTWLGYKCSKYPRMEKATRVYEFND